METLVIQVFKTDIRNRRQAGAVIQRLLKSGLALRCTVDLADIDKVLRVETKQTILPGALERFVRELGFGMEELPD